MRPRSLLPGRLPELSRLDPEAPELAPLRILARRCDEADLTSCWLLGDAWERGEASLEASERNARRLYRRACREGALGCVAAARVHPVQERYYLRRGCRRDVGPACERWFEVSPDEEERAEARRRGCDAGWLGGCEDGTPVEACEGPVSRCLERADALPRDAAVALLRHACDGERSAGCFRYGQRSEDPGAAMTAFRRACEAGDVRGCRAVLERVEVGSAEQARLRRQICAMDRESCR